MDRVMGTESQVKRDGFSMEHLILMLGGDFELAAEVFDVFMEDTRVRLKNAMGALHNYDFEFVVQEAGAIECGAQLAADFGDGKSRCVRQRGQLENILLTTIRQVIPHPGNTRYLPQHFLNFNRCFFQQARIDAP